MTNHFSSCEDSHKRSRMRTPTTYTYTIHIAASATKKSTYCVVKTNAFILFRTFNVDTGRCCTFDRKIWAQQALLAQNIVNILARVIIVRKYYLITLHRQLTTFSIRFNLALLLRVCVSVYRCSLNSAIFGPMDPIIEVHRNKFH